MTIQIDQSGTAHRPDPASFASWASDQRVFISSTMGALTPLRGALANAIADLGAYPVWFEDFGGRDDDAEVAYLGEVATSTIYLGILGREYGRIDKAQRLSATHAEYREAERLGLPVSVWVQQEEDMLADEFNFLSEVRLFHTTGSFTDESDLVSKVSRRLEAMCAEAVSPWAKLGDAVIRARDITDDGRRVVLRAAVHSRDVLAILEGLRPTNFGGREVRLTWAGRSVPVRVTDVTTTTTASRSTAVVIEMQRGDTSSGGSPFGMTASFSFGTSTYTSDDLAVLDMRRLLFQEELPSGLHIFGGSIHDFTVDLPGRAVPTALYQAVFALLATEALVESGRAMHVESAQISPVGPGGRRIRLAWVGHTDRGGRRTRVSLDGVMPVDS
ncbi:DUF4062 domain-containing protein [Terrabacter sp. BE26]|uniref:DUF4062 domain-containing protein n=1 Tax=Terrabacter sp. BE26 TaxID=2898152 RepID=UPI0035BE8682